MQLTSSSIGRKILMSITGQAMVLFAVVHLLGNSSIFGWLNGGINAYAEHLHSMPIPIIVGFRLALLVMVCVHIWFGITLTIENTAALKNLVPLHNEMVPNVLGMVVAGFKNFFVSFIYAGAMVVLFLHLSHGIQSFFQTMGWSNDKSQPLIIRFGTLVALGLFLGYVTIPLTIFAGILKG